MLKNKGIFSLTCNYILYLIIKFGEYDQVITRRRGGDFRFCCVVVFEICQYFRVLPPCENKNGLLDAFKDYRGERPLRGRGARV
ncbi:MAG: hypothetical protein DBY09_04225 [Selenomonadales bacterium]|nr:MAG: hypothetical protein DBY09_04225 [Selenomonadales bacterium]